MRKRAEENIWTYEKANKIEGAFSTTIITLTKEEKREHLILSTSYYLSLTSSLSVLCRRFLKKWYLNVPNPR
jgi:hypothetical protein